MTQAVTLFRWDDAGAPQIGTGNLWPGILTVLKKCLVEGYGTKDPAGWTVEYEDVGGSKCVFRNDPVVGSGGYVQFQRQADTVIWFKSALSMTDVDEFINDGYMCSINMNSGSTFNNAKWIIQATATGFYLSIAAASETTYSGSFNLFTIFVGDFISFAKNDVATFIAVAPNTSSKTSASNGTSLAAVYFPINSHATLTNIYTTSGVPSGTQLLIEKATDGDLNPISVYGYLTPINNNNVGRRSETPLGPTLMDKFYISRYSTDTLNQANCPPVRGFLPGLVCTPIAFYYLANYPQILEINNSLHFGLQDTRSNAGTQGGIRRWINCEQWEALNRD